MTSAPNFSQGNFLPENLTIPSDSNEFVPILKRVLEDHASMINRKDTAQYETVEVQCNQTYPGNTPQVKRQVYRKIYAFGALAAGATLNIPHAITGLIQITRLYGSCTTAIVDYRPIPYASATVITNQIEVLLVGANIVVINGATSPNITSGYIVCEFLKN